jgi:hypothetical protein
MDLSAILATALIDPHVADHWAISAGLALVILAAVQAALPLRRRAT